ncbi:glycosyltransferase [Sphingomonas changnyeongensis]|uniref:Glycosyltransferase n=1 Tax=Sphingomonas changnyeongensis TaxID=2698679 RepID=A0A7Z2S7Y4_9SPHN|nr:glycosyltransferase family 2 protein [Sphingomonas changnyeongensis]QHL90117.1 glycosyltransferase [Sphingomonas changnyeongensis]
MTDHGEDAPDLSILMVSWNTREMTLAAIRSVYAETRDTRFEVILVDNGSADGTVDAVRAAFPQVRLLAERENHGFAKGNNIAARAATGRLLLLLNTDTLVRDRAIDRLMAFAAARPEARIWGGRTLFGDGRLNPSSAWNRITAWSAFCLAVGLTTLNPRSPRLNPEQVALWGDGQERAVDIVSGCFFLVERSLWEQLDGFDTTFFMYGEEADFCGRARRAGARPRVTPEAEIVHFGGGSAVRPTNTLVYLFGARIGLALRHLPPASARIARAMTIFQAWWRALLYGLAARLSPGRRDAASQWREMWRRRAEWRDGPVRAAL